jgi:hypothetical protein
MTSHTQPLYVRPQWRTLLILLGLCLSALGSLYVPARHCTLCRALDERWSSLRDTQIPMLLRAIGLLPPSPEMVARATLRALDRRDARHLDRLSGQASGPAAAMTHVALSAWPAGVLDRPSTWVTVGPYTSEPWYIPAPHGAVRRIPVRLYHPSGCALCVIWLRATGAEWHLLAITDIVQEAVP